jgi:hypothetical protein
VGPAPLGTCAGPLQFEALLSSSLHGDRSRRCAPGALRHGQFRPVALLPPGGGSVSAARVQPALHRAHPAGGGGADGETPTTPITCRTSKQPRLRTSHSALQHSIRAPKGEDGFRHQVTASLWRSAGRSARCSSRLRRTDSRGSPTDKALGMLNELPRFCFRILKPIR